MALEHVLSPINIRGVELRNRVVRTAHNTLIGGGDITDDLIAYHEARAKGGVALSILEVGLVHPSAPVGTRLYTDAVIGGYRRLAPAMHMHGMKVFQQLWHPGHQSADTRRQPALVCLRPAQSPAGRRAHRHDSAHDRRDGGRLR